MRTKKGLEFWVNKDIRCRSFDLAVFKHEPHPFDKEFVAGPLVFQPVAEAGIITPTMPMSYEEAEALMTELWRAGVRPQGVGTEGELASVRYHLEDMRRIVSGLKPVNEQGR